MHMRRFACFLLGLWLGGSLFMAAMTAQNFRLVDRLLANPAPAAARLIQSAGPEGARLLLRYQASEANRWYAGNWDTLQLGLAALLFFLLLFGSQEGKLNLLAAMFLLLLVLGERLLLAPEIIARSRLLDFLPPEIGAAERSRLWVLQSASTGVQMAKLAMGLLLAARLLGRFNRGRA
jgi:hypothetical protein